MRAELPQAALHAALQRLAPALSAKPAAAGPGDILLRAEADGFALQSGNGGVAVEARLDEASGEAVIHRNGRILIPSRCLVPVIRCLPPGSVMLETVPGPTLAIRAGNALYRISGSGAEHYPDSAAPRQAQTFEFANARLKPLIRRLAFAAASSDARPVLTGISCSVRSDGIALTATDGVRLSSQRIAWVRSGEVSPAARAAVIPAKPWLDFAALLTEEGSTAMMLGASSVQFQTAGMRLQLPLLEGAYPPLGRFSDPECGTSVTVAAADFLRMLERTAALAGETRAVTLATDGSSMTLAARTEGVGDVVEQVPVQALQGSALTITFNGSYMRDFMRAAEGSAVTLRFSGPLRPIVIRTADEPASLFALTPIRTAGNAT
ncbi:DNA polymerase III subunit beta [Paenibacillus lycopersici]|uniref:Beta sliding clamp n=1 Tax=Paenibacillus lycopersici TaxID=2704462 RepID=A0A6C0G2L7_9BACL|nr:DNA polymerase III subunit beta [Paenibacillus lycopersici]QHT63626.1 DNA polymerase III subunit beta [Paenibacillus lycopersici]